MRKNMLTPLAALLAWTVAATPVLAGRSYEKVKGEVIKVEQQVRTQNGGVYDRLTIRTRQGEEMKLHLGREGACEGCFQVGDQLKAKLHAGAGPEAECRVRFMKVRREGEVVSFHGEDGRLVRSHDGSGRGLGKAEGRRGRGEGTARGGRGAGGGRGSGRHRG